MHNNFKNIIFTLLTLLSVLFGSFMCVIYLSVFPTISFFPEINDYILRLFPVEKTLLEAIVACAAISFITVIIAYLSSYKVEFKKRPNIRTYLIGLSVSGQIFSLYLTSITVFLNDILAFIIGFSILLFPPFIFYLFEKSMAYIFRKIGFYFYRNSIDKGTFKFLSKALLFNPADTPAREMCGLAYYKQKEYDSALKYLQPLDIKGKVSTVILNALGNIYTVKKQWDNAIGIYQRLSLLVPNNAEIEDKLIDVYTQSDNIEDAIKIINNKKTKKMSDLIKLTDLYKKKEDFENILLCCDKIFTLDSSPYILTKELYKDLIKSHQEDIIVLRKIAEVYLKAGEFIEAASYFEKILSIDPSLKDVRDKLIEIYRTQMNYEKLSDHLKYLIDNNQGADPNIILEYCDILINRKNPEDAYDILKTYEKECEGNPKFQYLIASIFFDKDDYLQAASYINTLSDKQIIKEDYEIKNLKKKIDEKIHNLELDEIEKKTEENPQDIELRFELINKLVQKGYIERVSGELDSLLSEHPEIKQRVLKHLSELIEKTDKPFRLIDFLSDIYFRDREFDEVFKLYTKMSERSFHSEEILANGCIKILHINPNHLLSLNWMLKYYLKFKKYDKAITIGEKLKHLTEDKNELSEIYAVLFEAYLMEEDNVNTEIYGRLMSESDVDSFDKLKKLGLFYKGINKKPQALEILKRARDLNNQDREIYSIINILSDEVKKDRRVQLGELVEKNPNNYELFYELANLHYEFGDINKAIICYQKASIIPAISNISKAKIALCLADKKILDLAEETLKEVSLKDENDPKIKDELKRILFDIAWIFEEENDPTKALNIYKQIFKVDAGYKNIVEKIAKLTS